MKKIISTIIVTVVFISSVFPVSANNGRVVELFDLYNGVEEYSLWLIKLEKVIKKDY